MGNVLLVALEQHFIEYKGAVYTDIAFAYPYWQEYLKVFNKVCPIARVQKVNTIPEGWQRADGDNVSFICVTDYLGFWQFLSKALVILSDCYKATRGEGCYLLRLGNISTFCWLWLILKRRKYAFEAVGHAGESVLLVKNVQMFGLAKIIAFINHLLSKLQAKFAFCASYTSRYVQSLYPTKNKSNEWVFSSVKLKQQVLTSPRSKEQFQTKPFHIVSVGRLEPEKGHAVLVDALADLNEEGVDFTAKIIGPGKEIDNLQRQVAELGLTEKVCISAAVPWGPQLFKELDNGQLFVLPSITEGMPRALIEAMARGLPAIGSNTGGIKELLGKEYLVPSGDSMALTKKITEIMDNPERLEMMSRVNFEKAMDYRPEIMNQRKTKFWRCIKNNCP